TFRGVFIRAPAILDVGPEVQVLADYPVPSDKVLSSDSSVEGNKAYTIFGLISIFIMNCRDTVLVVLVVYTNINRNMGGD
ncbi:pyridoxal biosynthesis protein PDX2-like, partial [Trifolium medium]|nr:pyridoxal biosynthesis protein PDX2-like [Trifolium medium]